MPLPPRESRAYWSTIFMLPAFVPLVAGTVFSLLTSDDEFLKAIGPGGSRLMSRITMTLSLTTMVMLTLGLGATLWYASKSRPRLPPDGEDR